ncbi:hypothetical protein JOF56_007716 [Kibdelosporangium banguiense]|uniref:Uncharacterized protein n=1 Tax=Kibdelosporangium banguiense TaxID=1365924 RepID=A0ABS4TSG4_9PSEU|nr:hypothetical protein [Kibdelosporangium banguiense]MBP2327331.1 hypothetical protein [Kibdelosporangium banguiense]
MAIRLKMGGYARVDNDPLGRSFVGYFPRMTEAEAWEVGRGMWRMNAGKARRQRFAIIVGEGLVRAVAEISAVTVHGDRAALEGAVLAEGHSVRDVLIGQPDPVVNRSQNPVGYRELLVEKQFVYRLCACGCGGRTDRDFLAGHDVRAIQARVREHFGGSQLRFVRWVDRQLATD